MRTAKHACRNRRLNGRVAECTGPCRGRDIISTFTRCTVLPHGKRALPFFEWEWLSKGSKRYRGLIGEDLSYKKLQIHESQYGQKWDTSAMRNPQGFRRKDQDESQWIENRKYNSWSPAIYGSNSLGALDGDFAVPDLCINRTVTTRILSIMIVPGEKIAHPSLLTWQSQTDSSPFFSPDCCFPLSQCEQVANRWKVTPGFQDAQYSVIEKCDE